MIGQTFECAIWYNADNPADIIRAREGLEEAFLRAGVFNAVKFGPIAQEDVSPDDSRLPPPPFRGNVRCLIGTAYVVGRLEVEEGKLTDDLTADDLAELRRRTRAAFMKAGGFSLTDEECDSFINEHGPDVVWNETIH